MIRSLRLLPLLATVILATGMVHTHLVKSLPARGEELATAPKEILLWFSERPEIPFTSVTLMRGDSTRIVTAKAVAAADSMAASIPLQLALPPGKYLVAWRTASRDGHAIRGTFGFSILP